MINRIKKLFGKETLAERLEKAIARSVEDQINAQIKEAYNAHIVAFHREQIQILENWAYTNPTEKD